MIQHRENRYVILGSGIAGISAAEEIRKADHDAEIIMVTDEEDLCFNRPMLIEDFSTDGSGETLFVEQSKWPGQLRIDLITGVRATSIDREGKKVKISDGSELEYDKLIYAIGADPCIPEIPGSDSDHVFSVRTRADMKKIREAIPSSANAVVIGGGMLGLEDAWALCEEKLQVAVIEKKHRIAFGQIDQSGSNLIKKRVERFGVSIYLDAEVEEIGEGYVTFREAVSDSGCGRMCQEGCKGNSFAELVTVPADLVIFSTGVIPNTTLAEEAGLETESEEGLSWIVTDGNCRTSDPDIYAAGDAVSCMGDKEAIWDKARQTGRIAGSNAAEDLLGRKKEGREKRPVYGHIVPEHVFNGFDTEILTIGDSSGDRTEGVYIRHADVEIFDYQRERYIRVSMDKGKIAGILLINASELAPDLMEAFVRGDGEDEARAIISRWKKDHEVDFKPAAKFKKR